ncbi:MAG: Gfo/Idh/MocA family oxidoreductase [bacterium]
MNKKMQQPETKDNAEIRVGVVGVGYLGQHHARNYAEMPGVRLAGVADVDQGRAQEIARRHATRVFLDYLDMIPDVDAVSIVSPTVTHFEIARDFLKQGVDVLVEKPMTETLVQAGELIRIAEQNQRILQVGHIERFNGAVRELERLVRDPGFIEVHRLSSFTGRATDVDVILDLMIHDIDIILSLVHSPVREIRAKGVPVITSNVDIANARLEFENGCVANVTASRVSTHPQRKMRFFQPDAYISIDFQEQRVACYRRVGDPKAFPDGHPPSIVEEKVSISKEEPLKVELTAFVEAVRTRSTPVVSGQEGMKALDVATSILREIGTSERTAYVRPKENHDHSR